MQPSTHGKVHWKESARRTGKAKWAGWRRLLEIGEMLIDPFDEAKGFAAHKSKNPTSTGFLAELDSHRLVDLCRQLGLMPWSENLKHVQPVCAIVSESPVKTVVVSPPID
jgi:hypothetical protein